MISKIEDLSITLKKYTNSMKCFLHQYFFSVIFTIIIYLSAVLFVIIGLFIYTTHNNIGIVQKRGFLVKELNDHIIYFDEVLTMSARLAAFTGDMKWEERHESYAPQLDSAIKMVLGLTPKKEIKKVMLEVDTANLKMVAIEKHAFDLVMKGNSDSAISILFSKEYDEQKRLFANGINKVDRAADEYLQSILNILSSKSVIAYISIIIFIPILLFSWFVGHKYYKILLNTKNLLQDSEQRYRFLFESSSDAIMFMSEKGFFDCNTATLKIFDLSSKEEFIGIHPAELSPPQQPDGEDSMAAANKKILEAFKNGKNQFEWVHRRKNGKDFPAEVHLTAFRLDNRQVLQATVRDIFERKTLEEERILRSNLEAIHSTIVTINHEMNQPLSVIISSSDFLLKKAQKNSEIYEDIKIINAEAWRLAKLVKKTSEIKTLKTKEYSPGTKMIDLDDKNGENKDG